MLRIQANQILRNEANFASPPGGKRLLVYFEVDTPVQGLWVGRSLCDCGERKKIRERLELGVRPRWRRETDGRIFGSALKVRDSDQTLFDSESDFLSSSGPFFVLGMCIADDGRLAHQLGDPSRFRNL